MFCVEHPVDLHRHLVYFQHDCPGNFSPGLGLCSGPAPVYRHWYFWVDEPGAERNRFWHVRFYIFRSLRRCSSSNSLTFHNRVRLLQLFHPEWCPRPSRVEHLDGHHKTARRRLEHHCRLVVCIRLEPSIPLAELRREPMGHTHWLAR